ncbi:MAG: SIMPL domain-containing protein [Sulfurimonas sp.]|nr:SIMPL domain-containing protein [Sulfurimonas sp.]
MKNIILLLSMIFSLSNAFEVHKSSEFVKKVEPTKMSTSITAMVEDTNKLKIQKIFKKAIKNTASEGICANGSYRISPMYEYKKSKRIFSGYQGSIIFTCDFTDSKKLDNVIDNLERATVEKDKLKLTINPISWIVEKQALKQVNKELELEALNYAKSYKSFLSDVYEVTCKIKEVLLNPLNSPQYPIALRSMMRESGSQTTQPIKSEHTIKYSASYKFECGE